MVTVHEVFNRFTKEFLQNKKSIFSGEEILNTESIRYLKENFIENGISGKEKTIENGEKINLNFIIKIENQLISAPKKPINDNTIRNNAIEVLAHAVWVWRLSPSNSQEQGRLKSVNEILDLIDKPAKPDSNWFKDIESGFASAGTYYNTNKAFELAYIIEFFSKSLEIDFSESQDELVNWVLGQTTQKFKEIGKTEDVGKTVASHNALLHLLDKNRFLPILSNSYKENIVKCFKSLLSDNSKEHRGSQIQLNINLKNISDKLFGIAGIFPGKNFYQDDIRALWDEVGSPIETNTVYYGAPGTGKTYLTRLAAKSRVSYQIGFKKNDNTLNKMLDKRICNVQFHPSFTYEDFIDGLKPNVNSDGQIELKLTDGVFKRFCRDATYELKEYRRNTNGKGKYPPLYYFIVDEINRADLSSVFGEVFSCIENDKRIDFDGNGNLTDDSFTVKSQNAHLLGTGSTDAIVLPDKFGIPMNLIFIGTMNDIDRSIDTFDFALRRRFNWVYKGFDADVLTTCKALEKFDLEFVASYVDSCKKLNNFIAKDLGLGRSYEIGHAYFMNIKISSDKKIDDAKKKLFDQNIKPLLEEYLRSQYSGTSLSENLKKAKIKFIPLSEPDAKN